MAAVTTPPHANDYPSADFKARVQAAYQAPSRAIARELAAGIVADYLGIGERFEQTVS